MNGFHFHFQAVDPRDLAVLRKAGFDSLEISRLCQFRRTYKPTAEDEPELSREHLLFIRWLVQQGKLSEEIS